MNASLSSPSPFEINYIKNAKVIKTEIKPFLHNIVYIILNHSHLKMNPIASRQFLLLENIWIHISSILAIDLQPFLQNTHLSKLLFRNKKPPLFKHTEEQ